MMKKTLLFKISADHRLFCFKWLTPLLVLSMFIWTAKMDAYGDYPISDVDGGTITGGPFEFCVGDGNADHVSEVGLSGNTGSNSQWVVTDEDGKILGLPPNPEAVNFDGAGAGVCLLWHLSYEEGLEGLEAGGNVDGLAGIYDFSNEIRVYRNQPEAGTLTGGPFYITVDGTPDMVSGIAITGSRSGSNSTFVVTSPEGEILGIPPSLMAVEGIDFDSAGPGTCLIWHLRYEDGLEGLEMGKNTNDFIGCYDLSNYIEVVRTPAPQAGEIVGGPFNFCVDGTPDMASGLSLTGDRVGSMSSWVITDDKGKILGLPPTLEAVEGVDFDGAGPGTCLIWYLRYEEGLEGLAPDLNIHNFKGSFDLSNPVSVVRTRTEAGELVGGSFYFTVDGTPDMVSGISVTGSRSGANSTFVVTSPEGEILGIPPSLMAVEGIDFDEAGPGTCLIWHLRYEDGLDGLELGKNTNDLSGCFDLSNYIKVVRSAPLNGGEITGGPFEFCVGDGVEDHVSGVEVSGNSGGNSQWVVTSPEGEILGLPPSPEAVNFDGAGAGTCLIWHLSYADDLEGLEGGNNVADLVGDHDFSNYVAVYRNQPEAGTLTGGPFEFDVDGSPDMVSGIAVTGTRSGSNSTFVVTSPEGDILGIPPTLDAVEGIDFDEAGPGTCLIWHLRYEDGLEGLEMGGNTNDLMGCYDLSNYVEVIRSEAPMVDGGMLTGGPFEFCVGDEEADHVSGVELNGNTGSNTQWVVTSEDGMILGLPPSPEAVNFDGAGAGVCLIWHLSYENGLEGLEEGKSISDLSGIYDLSNEIRVDRNQPDAGTLTGGPFEFVVDGSPDMVSGITITGTRSGSNSTFVVTSPEGDILGIPPSLDAVEGIDFDEAGPGTCLIWHLRYEDGLEGLEMGGNTNDLMGCYDLSNYVEVVRLSDTSGKGPVSVFPLPATDVLHISSKSFDQTNVQMRLFDFAGNDISNKVRRTSASDLSFDVQSLSSGIYFLSLRNGKGQAVTKKIVIN
ncbi:MAG: T9SS type A sorting domain-containing protein [Aurantibacter sp.]